MRGWALRGVRSIGTFLTVMAAGLALMFFATPLVASAEVSRSDVGGLLLSGTLTLPGTTSPAIGAQVCADPLGSDGSETCAITDSTGRYTLTSSGNGLVQTSYRLYADQPPYPITYLTSTGSSVSRDDALAVDLTDQAEHTDLNFSLDAGVGVVGSVSLGSDTTTEALIEVCPKRTLDSLGCVDATITGSGDFAFRELSSGDYTVAYSAIGYNTVELLALVGDGILQLDPVTLTRTEPGNLTGTVVDSQGNPLSDATVSASNVKGATSPDAVLTDAQGRFSFSAIAADLSWQLDVTKPGYGTARRTQWLASAATADIGQIRLARSASVSIKVQNTSSAAITNAQLTLCTDGFCTTPQADAGTYTFTGLNPGRYVLEASHDDYLPAYYPGVAERQSATVIRVAEATEVELDPLTLIRPGKLTGTTHSTVSNLSFSPSTGYVVIYDATKHQASTTSITDGSFTSGSLRPGDYYVQTAGVPKFADGDLVPVTVVEGQTASVGALDVSPNPQITGKIQVGGQTITNNPYISFQGSGRYPFQGYATDGSFDFRLPVDTYSVSVDVNGSHVCGPDQAKPCVPSTITVAGSDLNQNVSVPGLGTLKGQIDVSAFSSPHLETTILDADGREVAGKAWTAQSSIASYEEQLVPGTYTLVVTADDTWTQRFANLEITDGETTIRDIMLAKVAPPTYTLSGSLTLPQFEREVTLTVVDVGSGDPVNVTRMMNLSAGSHRYKVPRLPAGEYLVYVEAGDTEVWYPNAELPQWASVIDLTANRTGLNITLPPTRVRVSGKLSLPQGLTKPDGAEFPPVTLHLVSGSSYSSTTAIPDADGRFATTVPAGVYVLMVENSDTLGTLRYVGDPFPVNSDTAVANIALVAGGALHGQVMGSDGIPVAGAAITVSGDHDAEEYATTDADGLWQVNGFPEGKVGIKAEAPDFATAVAMAEVSAGTSTEVPLTMQAYGRLSVKLSAPSEELAKTGVTMVVVGADGKQVLQQTMAPDGQTRQIGSLPAGEPLKIGFRGGSIDETWWQGAGSVAGATPVTLDSGTVTLIAPELNFTLGKGVISGHVTDNTDTQGHVVVSAFASGGRDSQSAGVDAQGEYKLLLLPGSYFVRAELCIGLWTTSEGCVGKTRTLWNMPDSQTSPELLQLAPEETVPGVDFTFEKWEFASAPAPWVAGTPDVGNTLTASVGMWGPAPVSLSYQWYRSGQAISGATGTRYTVTEADRGRSLTVKVTGTKAGYRTTSAVSAATSEVPDVLSAVSAASPKISGTAKVGYRLTAVPGTWSPSTIVLRYQWYASGTAISGATASSFVLTPAQRGKTMTVKVTGWLNGTPTITTSSSPTVAVAAGTLTAKTPVISGTAKVGKTLKAKAGTWGPTPVTLRYQWYANGKKISKATKSSYKIAKKYKGKKITVKVTGSKTGYSTVSKKSKATNSVK